MYSWEIRQLLELKRNVLEACSEDLMRVTSVDENPQLDHIKFDNEHSEYEMWDSKGEYFKFKVKVKEKINNVKD